MISTLRLTVFVIVTTPLVALYTDPHCNQKQVIVHLFEWRWDDIALECERFLSKKGFCGVQISPPHEHLVEINPRQPWWDRYQPVSYELSSRSGTETQFMNMVQRCNNVGVRIYVDVIMNHMTAGDKFGNGSAGSYFDGRMKSYPAVPYSSKHFTPRHLCPSSDGDIHNYNNAREVRNCNLAGLQDLDLSQVYVREKIANYLNRLLDIGVSGFRMDAAKHMWPRDILAILNEVNDLPSGGRPFVYSEVIDNGGEPIRAQEYVSSGYVTEFRFCKKIGEAVREFSKFNSLFDPRSDMVDTDHAFIFVDNHDNQRHGADGGILTFKSPNLYKLAVTFTLAYDYGFTRLMSSYTFDSFDDGPPHSDDYRVKNVTISMDGNCRNGWVCEHRWSPIANMVVFRNKMVGLKVNNFRATKNVVSLSRGKKGFFLMSKSGAMDKMMYTGLPEGNYCDIVSGCSRKILVQADGKARIVINPREDPMIAIMTDACDQINPILPPLSIQWKRTVILIYVETAFGLNVFIRGGIDHNKKQGCTFDASTSKCAIPIRHKPQNADVYSNYNEWAQGDNFIDWYGKETRQSKDSHGTPLIWTTDDEDNAAYNTFNKYGPNFWLLDVSMLCSHTHHAWFEFKALKDDIWENDVNQKYCLENYSTTPYPSSNHFAKCGFINIFSWSSNSCIMKEF